MAEKKDDKKKPVSIGTRTPGQELIYLLAGLLLLAVVLGQIAFYINKIGWGNFTTIWNYFLHSYFFPLWNNWKYVAVFISAISFIWIIHSHRKLAPIKKEEEKIYGTPAHDSVFQDIHVQKEENERWKRVMSHARSTNSADWRLAIMEADILLEETLRKNGFPGDTVGEMLKSAQPGDFLTLDAAGEAHGVRNRIAHGGGDFDLNERETLRVISLFESVFKEFKII
jgi:hypothetical protein